MRLLRARRSCRERMTSLKRPPRAVVGRRRAWAVGSRTGMVTRAVRRDAMVPRTKRRFADRRGLLRRSRALRRRAALFVDVVIAAGSMDGGARGSVSLGEVSGSTGGLAGGVAGGGAVT